MNQNASPATPLLSHEEYVAIYWYLMVPDPPPMYNAAAASAREKLKTYIDTRQYWMDDAKNKRLDVSR